MASLVDLGKQIYASPQGPMEPKQQAIANTQSRIAKGDDLISAAQKMADLSDSEKEYIQRFETSRKIVEQKIGEDEGYGMAAMKRLQAHQGDKLADALIDEADNIKIDYLKKNDPKFVAGDAFVTGLLNEASFGQLSKLYGKAGELLQGRPYEDVVKEQAERIRLYEKAFPGTTIAGKVASYLLPGSPAKALFTSVAKVGTKAAGALIPRLLRNPKLVTKALEAAGMSAPVSGALGRVANVATNAITSAIAGGAGTAAVAGTRGALGTNLQGFDLDRGIDDGIDQGVTAAIISGALPVAGAVIGETAKAFGPGVSRVAQRVDQGVGRVVEGFTGTSQKALRAYGKNPAGVKAASGTQKDIADDLVDFLQNSKRSRLPELQAADDLLHSLPDVDVSKTIKFLNSQKAGLDPSLDASVNRLKEWATRIENTVGSGKVSASDARGIVDDLQNAAKDAFGKESNLYLSALKQASRDLRSEIVKTAEASGGEPGKLYGELMKKGADKVEVLKFIGKKLGSTDEMQKQNGERFIKTIFGTNKEFIRSRMSDLDSKFGTNFLERAELANTANQLGDKGVPALIPQQGTGAFGKAPTLLGSAGSALGLAAGGPGGALAGGAIGTGAGTILASPKVGRLVVGASEKISNFIQHLFADPQVITRIKNGAIGVGVPLEIRRMAYEIEKALIKDGPASASGVVRLVADTPYFIGLVHAYDVASRKQNSKTAQSALSKMKPQSQGIARPNQ